jgi:hypothetical protein
MRTPGPRSAPCSRPVCGKRSAARARPSSVSTRTRCVGARFQEENGADSEQVEAPFVPKKSTLSQNVSLQKLAHQNTASALPNTSYSNDYLAQLKAATPTRTTLAREPDAVIPYDEDAPMTGEDTTLGIPNEAAIASALARRRRAQDPAAAGEDDYVSLSADASKLAVYDHAKGPHPESRLQRESDSEGSGDEALAAFTGSKERLGLRKGGTGEAAARMRREMRDAIEDDAVYVGDEDEDAWEVEQVRRAGAVVEAVAEEKRGYASAKSAYVRSWKGFELILAGSPRRSSVADARSRIDTPRNLPLLPPRVAIYNGNTTRRQRARTRSARGAGTRRPA